jgi:hypothetical protein
VRTRPSSPTGARRPRSLAGWWHAHRDDLRRRSPRARLALTGCSDDGGSASPDRSPTAAAATGDGGSYASTEALLAALNERGVACTEPQTGTFEGVSQAQSCIVNDAEDVVLLRFASAGERTDYVASKDKLASAVVGVDWAVQTVLPQTAEQLASRARLLR